MIFLVKDKASKQIVGTYQGEKAPIPKDHEEFIEVNEQQFEDYSVMEKESLETGKLPVHDNGKVKKPVDDRLYVNAFLDESETTKDGSVNLTLQVLEIDGSENSTYSGDLEISLDVAGEVRLFRFSFSQGVASKTITSDKSGLFTLKSTPQIRIKTNVIGKFYE